MNSTPFADEPNIYFINGTTDLDKKVAFINTCDFMIHARERGETFGLTIAEFSTLGKPIITYRDSPERNHIDILGDYAHYYNNYHHLFLLRLTMKKGMMKKEMSVHIFYMKIFQIHLYLQKFEFYILNNQKFHLLNHQ